jgi:hypothetical protein
MMMVMMMMVMRMISDYNDNDDYYYNNDNDHSYFNTWYLCIYKVPRTCPTACTRSSIDKGSESAFKAIPSNDGIYLLIMMVFIC